MKKFLTLSLLLVTFNTQHIYTMQEQEESSTSNKSQAKSAFGPDFWQPIASTSQHTSDESNSLLSPNTAQDPWQEPDTFYESSSSSNVRVESWEHDKGYTQEEIDQSSHQPPMTLRASNPSVESPHSAKPWPHNFNLQQTSNDLTTLNLALQAHEFGIKVLPYVAASCVFLASKPLSPSTLKRGLYAAGIGYLLHNGGLGRKLFEQQPTISEKYNYWPLNLALMKTQSLEQTVTQFHNISPVALADKQTTLEALKIKVESLERITERYPHLHYIRITEEKNLGALIHQWKALTSQQNNKSTNCNQQ